MSEIASLDRRLQAARQQIGEAGEDAAGLGAADILRHRFGGDVEQRIAGEIAALGRQILDRIGDQPHGALQVGEPVGLSARHGQLSLPPASPGGGASRRPALAQRHGKRLQPDGGHARGGRRHHHVERGHQRPVEVALRQAAQGDQRRLVATDARAGRQMDFHGAPRAEQKGVHGDGEVGQRLQKARHLEAAMQGRALRRQRPILLPLAQRPQHEALADRQAAGAARPAAARLGCAWRGLSLCSGELSMTSPTVDRVDSERHFMQLRVNRNSIMRELRSVMNQPPRVATAGLKPRDRTAGIAASVDSVTLMSGRRELIIRHGADTYRLRITASNKLILTK